MNNFQDQQGCDIICKNRTARTERDLYRICPSKLSKRELENLYFALLENNLDLKKTVHTQQEKIKVLSTKLQRMTVTQRNTAGKERDCCSSKALVNEQKDSIMELKRTNERMADRIRLLNMRLCSAKQFLKRSPSQSSKCFRCATAPGSIKNVSMSALNGKPSNANVKMTAVSCQHIYKESQIAQETQTDEAETDLPEKDETENQCHENKCRTAMEEMKQKIVNLQEELSKTHNEYSSRIAALEKTVSGLEEENIRVRSRHAASEQALNQRTSSADLLRGRLRDAEGKINDLTMQLTIERRKVTELETSLKLAKLSSPVVETIERLSALDQDKPQAETVSRTVSICSYCNTIQDTEMGTSPRVQKSPSLKTKEEMKLSKSTDDSGYTDLNKSSENEEDKVMERMNRDLLKRVTELQTQLDNLRVKAAGETQLKEKRKSIAFEYYTADAQDVHRNDQLDNADIDAKMINDKQSILIEFQDGLAEKRDESQSEKIKDTSTPNKLSEFEVVKEKNGLGATSEKSDNFTIPKNSFNGSINSQSSNTLRRSNKNETRIIDAKSDEPELGPSQNKYQIPGPIASSIPVSLANKRKDRNKLFKYSNTNSKDSKKSISVEKNVTIDETSKQEHTYDDNEASTSKAAKNKTSRNSLVINFDEAVHYNNLKGDANKVKLKTIDPRDEITNTINDNNLENNEIKFDVPSSPENTTLKKRKSSVILARRTLSKELQNGDDDKANREAELSEIQRSSVSNPSSGYRDTAGALIKEEVKTIISLDPNNVQEGLLDTNNVDYDNQQVQIMQLDPTAQTAMQRDSVTAPKPSRRASVAYPATASVPSCRDSAMCTVTVAHPVSRNSATYAAMSSTPLCRDSATYCAMTSQPRRDSATYSAPCRPPERRDSGTYTKPDAPHQPCKCTRSTSPDNTEHEISSLSDLPPERDGASPRDTYSPGEERAATTQTDTGTGHATEYGSLSEGELPASTKGRTLSIGEKPTYAPISNSVVGEATCTQLEATLAAIGDQLSRCRALLAAPAPSQNNVGCAASRDPPERLHALRPAAAVRRLPDTHTHTCIFTLHIGTLVLSDEAVLNFRDKSLILMWKFFDQNVTMARMRPGRIVLFDFSTEYDVTFSEEFLNYMKQEELLLVICEINKQHEPFATCALPLRDALLHANRRADMSLALVVGPGMQRGGGGVRDPLARGDELGVLDLWCALRVGSALLHVLHRAISSNTTLPPYKENTPIRSNSRTTQQSVEDEQSQAISQDISIPDSATHIKRSRQDSKFWESPSAQYSQPLMPKWSMDQANSSTAQNVDRDETETHLNTSEDKDPGAQIPDISRQYHRRSSVPQKIFSLERHRSSGYIASEVPANIRSTDEMKKALERNVQPLTRFPKIGDEVSKKHSTSLGCLATFATKQMQKITASQYLDNSPPSPLQTKDVPDSLQDLLKKERKISSDVASISSSHHKSHVPLSISSKEDVTAITKKYNNISFNKVMDSSKKTVSYDVEPKYNQSVEQQNTDDDKQVQSIDITVLWLALNEECDAMVDPNIHRLYVAYSFLGRSGAELETPVSLPKPKHYADKCYFNFKKTFHLHEADLLLLGHMSRCRAARAPPDPRHCLVFSVVSEPPEDPLGLSSCEDIGYAHLYLGDILAYSAGGGGYTEVIPVRSAPRPKRDSAGAAGSAGVARSAGAARSHDTDGSAGAGAAAGAVCGVLGVRVDGLHVLRRCLTLPHSPTDLMHTFRIREDAAKESSTLLSPLGPEPLKMSTAVIDETGSGPSGDKSVELSFAASSLLLIVSVIHTTYLVIVII